MSLSDFKMNLQDELARADSALSLADRLAGFVAGLESAGFAVKVDLERLSAVSLQVALIVDLPTEMLDAAPAQINQSVLPRNARSPRWTQEQDARLVELVVAGHTLSAAAKELGRPVEATRQRARNVLKEHIAAARAAASKPDQEPAHAEAIEGEAKSEAAASESPAAPDVDQETALGFTKQQDDSLRRYMAQDMGIGGAAALLKMPRDQVAARWAQLQRAAQ